MKQTLTLSGPWRVCAHPGEMSIEADGYTVALGVSDRDAPLVAAAPELLNIVLELIHAHRASGPDHITGRIDLLLLQAQQIATKATGGA